MIRSPVISHHVLSCSGPHYIYHTHAYCFSGYYCSAVAGVAQLVRAFAQHTEGSGSNPGHVRYKTLKQVVTAPMLRFKCHGSSEIIIINGCPVSQ